MIVAGEYEYDPACGCEGCLRRHRKAVSSLDGLKHDCLVCGYSMVGPADVMQAHMLGHYQGFSDTVKSKETEKNFMGNVKSDKEKAPMGDLDLSVLEVVSRVFGYGNTKYKEDNFLNSDVATVRRYVGACLRHLAARQRGELLDESGLPHLAHAIASLMIALRHDGMPGLDKFWK